MTDRLHYPSIREQMLDDDFLSDDWDEDLDSLPPERTLARVQELWAATQNINQTARMLGKEHYDVDDVVDSFNFLNRTWRKFKHMEVLRGYKIPFILVDRRIIPWEFPEGPNSAIY